MEASYQLPFERFERYCPYGTAEAAGLARDTAVLLGRTTASLACCLRPASSAG